MLIHTLGEDFLQARKARNAIAANILGVLLGELKKLEKDRPGKPITDDDFVRAARKLIESNGEILKVAPDNEKAKAENAILESYMPKMMDDVEIRAAIQALRDGGAKDMKAVMAGLRAGFPGRYDGKRASELAKELLS